MHEEHHEEHHVEHEEEPEHTEELNRDLGHAESEIEHHEEELEEHGESIENLERDKQWVETEIVRLEALIMEMPKQFQATMEEALRKLKEEAESLTTTSSHTSPPSEVETPISSTKKNSHHGTLHPRNFL